MDFTLSIKSGNFLESVNVRKRFDYLINKSKKPEAGNNSAASTLKLNFHLKTQTAIMSQSK